jgi:hypothetical protein
MVGARRHLWNHAAKWCMDRRLARNAFGEHLTPAAYECHRTLIAARLNR